MTTRAAIVAEARSWLGTRWQHQASVKGVACDCIGFVAGVAYELGIDGAAQWKSDQKLHQYARQPDPAVLVAACDALMQRIPVGQANVADVLVMRFEKEPQHFGLLVEREPMRMIHAWASARKVAEHDVDTLWRSRIVRAYRFRGVE